jgi:type I restriction enzyme, S subunit
LALSSKQELISEWDEIKLGDLLTLNYGKGLPQRERIGGEFPVYGSGGQVGTHKELLVKGPGIILGRKGTIGDPVYVKKDYWAIDTTYYIEENKAKYDLAFIYYLLTTIDFKNMNSDSAVPGLNRTAAYSIHVKIPSSLVEQKRIAKQLSIIDNQIDINNTINQKLEKIGHHLFKHWFIEFEFPNKENTPYKSSDGELGDSELGKIPIKWDIKAIDEIANFLNGAACQKYPPSGNHDFPVIKIREMSRGINENTDMANGDINKKYIINDGDLLFSWSASLLVKFWAEGKGFLNQHIFKVTSNDFEPWYLYYWIKHFLEKFIGIAQDKATTMGHIKRSHLSSSYVLIPDEETLNQMNKIMNPIIIQLVQNEIQNRKLSKIRDTLLPKLMSGEIRV